MPCGRTIWPFLVPEAGQGGVKLSAALNCSICCCKGTTALHPAPGCVSACQGHKMTSVQVAADTFIYTPLNVGLFFALMTVVEGGRWTVSLSAYAGLLQKGYMHKVSCNALTSVQICLLQFNYSVAVRLCIACACSVAQSAPSSLPAMHSQDSPDKVLDSEFMQYKASGHHWIYHSDDKLLP